MTNLLERGAHHDRQSGRGDTPGSLWAAGALLVLVLLVVLGAQLGYRDVDIWGALVLPVLLFAAIAPVVAAAERRQATPFVGLMVGGLAARLLGAWLRYLVSFHVYAPTDPLRYHREGMVIARSYWSGDLSLLDLIPRGTDTQFVVGLSGLVHAFNGGSLLGAFMVFTVLSYLGGLFMVHAARAAVPQLLTKRYALLVMFLPSMLYWPSSLGKDGPMQLGIGLAAYGAARLFDGKATGWVWATTGIYFAGVIRPHVAVLLIAAVGVPLSIGRSKRTAGLGPLARLLAAFVLVLGLSSALGAMGDRLGKIDYTDPLGSTDSVLTRTESRTAQGGSAIQSSRANSPLEYPVAALTVLFRPLIFEADSATTAASAVEGTALIIAVWRWRNNLRAGLGLLRSNRYVAFVLTYSLVFMLAWSSINNLGIIARQRVMMLPLLAVLVCVAPDAAPSRRAA